MLELQESRSGGGRSAQTTVHCMGGNAPSVCAGANIFDRVFLFFFLVFPVFAAFSKLCCQRFCEVLTKFCWRTAVRLTHCNLAAIKKINYKQVTK